MTRPGIPDRMVTTELGSGVTLRGAVDERFTEVLSADAVAFVAELARRFSPAIAARLEARRSTPPRLAFDPATRAIREGDWHCAPLPPAILDRRVEITGPVDRKMIINALNSGASVFMADFEDANSPTRQNALEGQKNLFDAVRGTIEFVAEDGKKRYRLEGEPAVLFVRPRGFHLVEAHLEVDGQPVPGMLVDFGFYVFHNAKTLLAKGRGPYFYLPKMEHHLEARVWRDIFVFAESTLGLPTGTIKATCLVETLPLAFQMDEVLYELRDHSAGLNCGRWDYIFSYIKSNVDDATRILPDRALVSMTQPMMRSYSRLVIKTCHRRRVHAMGGMAAQIPIKGDDERNLAALEKVRADKLREVEDGHDGTWVAHPALVRVAKDVFDTHMPGKNQLDSTKQRTLTVSESDLLTAPEGPKTEVALRHNVRVAVQYIEAWLSGRGAVPLYDLMEDAATAEISRAQVWQWLHHGVKLDTGLPVTRELVQRVIEEELVVVANEVGQARIQSGRFREARAIFFTVATAEPFLPFLTSEAYPTLIAEER